MVIMCVVESLLTCHSCSNILTASGEMKGLPQTRSLALICPSRSRTVWRSSRYSSLIPWYLAVTLTLVNLVGASENQRVQLQTQCQQWPKEKNSQFLFPYELHIPSAHYPRTSRCTLTFALFHPSCQSEPSCFHSHPYSGRTGKS